MPGGIPRRTQLPYNMKQESQKYEKIAVTKSPLSWTMLGLCEWAQGTAHKPSRIVQIPTNDSSPRGDSQLVGQAVQLSQAIMS